MFDVEKFKFEFEKTVDFKHFLIFKYKSKKNTNFKNQQNNFSNQILQFSLM